MLEIVLLTIIFLYKSYHGDKNNFSAFQVAQDFLGRANSCLTSFSVFAFEQKRTSSLLTFFNDFVFQEALSHSEISKNGQSTPSGVYPFFAIRQR